MNQYGSLNKGWVNWGHVVTSSAKFAWKRRGEYFQVGQTFQCVVREAQPAVRTRAIICLHKVAFKISA